MSRFTAILILILAVGIIAVGVIWLLRPAPTAQTPTGTVPQTTYPTNNYIPPANTQQDQGSQAAVQDAYKQEIAPYNNDNVKLYQTVISGGYALQVWMGDHTGGQALLKYDSLQGKWIVITGGGGEWSLGGLVGAGVPTTTAQALIAGVPH